MNSFLAGLKSVDICIKALSAVAIWAHDLKVGQGLFESIFFQLVPEHPFADS